MLKRKARTNLTSELPSNSISWSLQETGISFLNVDDVVLSFFLSTSFLRQLHKFQTLEFIYQYPHIAETLCIVSPGSSKDSCLLRAFSDQKLVGFHVWINVVRNQVTFLMYAHGPSGGNWWFPWNILFLRFAIEQVHRSNETFTLKSELTPYLLVPLHLASSFESSGFIEQGLWLHMLYMYLEFMAFHRTRVSWIHVGTQSC